MAILAYLGILVIVPLITEAKNDPFVKFHLKQGLVLLIAEVAAMFIGVFPFIGAILSPLVYLACLVLSVIGIVNAANHETKDLPLIGQWAKMFNF
jgi:uncharacterized membrane protein